jgi:hypothetical protein
MDKAWWDAYLPQVRSSKFAGALVNPWRARPVGVEHVQFKHYNNSGSGAVALAIALGASRVVMLGYDCQKTEGKAHWHGDHPKGLGNAGSIQQWFPLFDALSRQIPASVPVVNASRVTALKCFPTTTLEDALSYRKRNATSLHIESMHGLGDNIYARAFVKSLDADVYLSTPWPQLYEDLPNVHFVSCSSRLRTQNKNIGRTGTMSAPIPIGARRLKIQYTGEDFSRGSLIDGLKRCFGVNPGSFDLPKFDSPIQSNKPIAVIRPVTIRTEWRNVARNPHPAYIAWVAEQLKDSHHVVSIADLEPGKEWIDGPEPFAHQKLHKGELSLPELLGLVGAADIVVGGVGWIVPASLALGTRAFIVLGGQGGHNGPAKIVPPGTENIFFAKPDKFCECASMQHNCSKTISNLESQWNSFCSGTKP